MRINRFVVVLLGLGLVIIYLFIADNMFSQPQMAFGGDDPLCAEDHDHNHRLAHPPLGWPQAEAVLAWGAHFSPAMQLDTIESWQQCNVEYYSELAERRAAAIEFSQTYRPKIVWIGNDHGTPKTREDDRVYTQWLNQQKMAVEIVDQNPDIAVFAYEDARKEDILTDPSVIKDERSAVAVIIATRPYISVIPGEECPIRFHRYLLYDYFGGSNSSTGQIQIRHDDCVGMIHSEMSSRVSRVRTEITIIRVLETLQELGEDTGAILQGRRHAEDLDELSEIYDFRADIYNLKEMTRRNIR